MTEIVKDKVVLVTGASRGIGRSVALAFAGQGARLVLAARSPDRLAAVEAEIRDLGAEALSVPTDVTSPADVTALIDAAVSDSGGSMSLSTMRVSGRSALRNPRSSPMTCETH